MSVPSVPVVSGWISRVAESVQAGLRSIGVDPVLAGVVVLIAFGALGYGAYRVVRRYRQPGHQLSRLLRGYDEVALLMHPNPDPDAMGAALGMKTIAEWVGTEATIYYIGQIRHHENRAFQAVLDLEFERISSVSDLPEPATVLVDHNRPRGSDDAETLSPTAVVDHHPGDGTGSRFTDVRPGYGACATIVAEYLHELNFEPVGPEEHAGQPQALSVTIATGLLYGIHADTDHLTNGATDAEFAMSRYLYPGIDDNLLRRIANPPVDSEVLKIKARAINNKEDHPPYLYSWVDTVSNLDAIPQAADELITLEGISTVVVAGEKDDTVHLSGRSTDDRVHIGRVLDAVAADIPGSSAGGHARMAGGQLSAAHVGDDFETRLFETMSGDV